jgi:hypothetical protein
MFHTIGREIEEGRLAATVWRELRGRATRLAKKDDDAPATISERPRPAAAAHVGSVIRVRARAAAQPLYAAAAAGACHYLEGSMLG